MTITRDSYCWNHRELATLLTLSESLVDGENNDYRINVLKILTILLNYDLCWHRQLLQVKMQFEMGLIRIGEENQIHSDWMLSNSWWFNSIPIFAIKCQAHKQLATT